jgi:hypothetical protein
MSDELKELFARLADLAKVADIAQQPGNQGVPVKTLLTERMRHIRGQVRMIECKVSQERFR